MIALQRGLDQEPIFIVVLATLSAAVLHATWADLIRGPEPKKQDLRNKVFIVTGANSGIGKETARKLAQWGATVVMACRSVSKANAARNEILKGAKGISCDLRVLALDLCDFDSVHRFVEQLDKEQLFRLDGLVLNAGLMVDQRQVAKNGLEVTFLANHLGHFLLTKLLQQRLLTTAAETQEARVVVVSSTLHHFASCEKLLADPNSEKDYNIFKAYSRTKLANILFANELSRRLGSSGVTVNSLHPGNVETDMIQHMHFVMYFLHVLASPILFPFRKRPHQGAFTSVYVATSPELRGVSGKYFANSEPANPSRESADGDASQALWKLSEHLISQAAKKSE